MYGPWQPGRRFDGEFQDSAPILLLGSVIGQPFLVVSDEVGTSWAALPFLQHLPDAQQVVKALVS